MIDHFLAKEEWRKYQVVKHLERNAYFSLNKQELMDHLEVSNYLFNNLIEALIDDLENFMLNDAIRITYDDPFLHMAITGEASSATLLEYYVMESLGFRLLCCAFRETYNSVNDFSVKEVISYPIVYKEYKRLKRFLKKNDIQINRKFQLVSKNEQNLRLFMTELFAGIFKDNLLVYSDTDSYLVNQQIAAFPREHFTMHQRDDLVHYTYVTDIRLRQEHYLKETYLPLLNEEIQGQFCLPYFFSRVPASFAVSEKQAFTNYYITRSADLIDQVTVCDDVAKEYSRQLVAALSQEFPVLSGYPEKMAEFNQRLDFLHLQLRELSSGYEALQPAIDISYFQQNYPEILAFCRQYLESVKKTDLYDKKKFVFFNYLLLIVNTFPKEALLHTVKIHADFSYGELYNQFIEGNLIFFQTAGAIPTENIEEADIILTDNRALGETADCEYIVWLSPPRPLDWANLGQKIVQQRSKKYTAADEKRDQPVG